MSHLGDAPWWCAAIGAAAAGVLAVCLIRLRARERWWIALAWLPAVVVACLAPTFTLTGWHGLMHLSTVLSTLRGVPPEDPITAGYPVKIAWIPHYFLGVTSSLTRLPPMHLLAIVDAVLLAGSVVLVAAAAWRLTRDRSAAGLAGVLGLWGVSPFHGTPLGSSLAQLGDSGPARLLRAIDGRAVPIDKFFNPNTNQLGVLAGALALYALVRVAEVGQSEVSGAGVMRAAIRWLVVLGLAVLLAALTYPIAWIGIIAMALGAAGLLLVLDWPRSQWTAMLIGVAVALGTLPALPHILTISADKNPWARIVLDLRPAILLRSIGGPMLFALPTLVLLLARRSTLVDLWRARRGETLVVIGAAIGALASAWLLRVPMICEYKFLILAASPLACLAAPGIAELGRRVPILAAVVIAALLWGGAEKMAYRFFWPMEEQVRWTTPVPTPQDPDLDALYTFVRTQTPPDSVIIAADNRPAVFGNRSMFTGQRRETLPTSNGWNLVEQHISVYVNGHPTRVFMFRRRVTDNLLGPTWIDPPAQAVDEIRREIPNRPVYVITTSREAATKLESCGAFVVRWSRGDTSVLELIGPAAPEARRHAIAEENLASVP